MSLSWGILGTGTIASVLAEAIGRTPHHELAAVASRTQENANQFARDQGASRVNSGCAPSRCLPDQVELNTNG